MGTQKPPSKYIKYEKTKLKYPPKNLSKSLKYLLFISFHTHQKRQIGPIFQIAALLGLPDVHRQANKSITILSITQDIPKRVKRSSKMKILVTWTISVFWKDKLQVLIISIHLNESSSFIDKHPKHGWHKLWWAQKIRNDEFFYFKLQGHFNDHSSYANQENFHDNRNRIKSYLEIKEVIGKILMREDPQSINCCWDHKSWRWKSNPTTFKWFL